MVVRSHHCQVLSLGRHSQGVLCGPHSVPGAGSQVHESHGIHQYQHWTGQSLPAHTFHTAVDGEWNGGGVSGRGRTGGGVELYVLQYVYMYESK